MASISTNYNSAANTALSCLLGSASSKNYGNSLNDLLNSNSSSKTDSDDLYDLLINNSGIRDYNLPTDSSGNAYIPTIDDMNNASSPSSKLTLAKYVAEAILIQADASSRVENASRVEDLASQAQSVLDAVSDAVCRLTANAGTDAEAIKNALSSNQDTISATLNRLNTALAEVKNLLSKASSDVRTNVGETLSALDKQAGELASAAGVSWTSFTGVSDYTVSGYSASSDGSSSYSGTSALLDLLA